MNIEPVHVLLIDEDPDDARMIRDSLASSGHSGVHVTQVGRLSDGLQRLESEDFDVVLLDLDLPDSSGLETLARLRAGTSPEPVVVLGHPADGATSVAVLRQGAQDFLSKGEMSGPLLALVLGRAAGRRRAERESVRQNSLLKATNDVLRQALASGTEEEVAARCLTVAEELTGSAFGFVGRLGDSGDLHIVAASAPGWSARTIPKGAAAAMLQTMMESGTAELELGQARSLIINDPDSRAIYLSVSADHPPLTSFIGVPLRRGSQIAGLMALANKKRGYDSGDQQVVETLSATLAELMMREQADTERLEAQSRYGRLFMSVPLGLYRTTIAGQILDANPALVEMLGYADRESLLSVDAGDLWVHPEERQRQLDLLRRGAPVHAFEMELVQGDGTVIWVQDTVRAVLDADGQMVCLEGALEDITGRKRAEEEIQLQAGRAQALADLTQTLAVGGQDWDALLKPVCRRVADLIGDACVASVLSEDGQWLRLTACSHAGEAQNRLLHDLLDGAPCPAGEGLMGRVARTNKTLLRPIVSLDWVRETIWHGYRLYQERFGIHSLLIVPLHARGQVIGTLGLSRDTPGRPYTAHDRQFLETVADRAALALSNARLLREVQQRVEELTLLHHASTVFATSPDLNQVLNTAAQLVTAALGVDGCAVSRWERERDQLVTLIDHSAAPASWPTEPAGTTYDLSNYPSTRRVLVERRPLVVCASDSAADPREVAWMRQEHIQSMLIVPLVVRDEATGCLELFESRREREFAAAEIGLCQIMANQAAIAIENARLLEGSRGQAARVQQVLANVPDGVLLLDVELQIQMTNRAAEEYMAVLAGAVEGDRLVSLAGRPAGQVVGALFQHGGWQEMEAGNRVFEVISRPVHSGGSALQWVLVIREVTEQRAMQQRVQMQDRLAAVGQLAAGMAHDFNNIMAVILLYSQMMARSAGLSPEAHERLRIISDQCRHASNLIQQILDFCRQSPMERKPLELVPLLKEQVKMLQRTLPETIQVELHVEDGEYGLLGDPTRIQQVLMNLAVNARDAMIDGGVLRIGLSRRRDREPIHCTTCGELLPGDIPWLRLTVTDTGVGMPADILPRIFEPFFTTKRGHGTGLGLAQVYGIVKQHDGHIDVSSILGNGSTFTLWLPALSAVRHEESEAVEPMQGEGQTILVVEDNPATRAALVTGLEALHYRVLAAGDGQEALALLRQQGRQVAAVLSDMVMPGMGGVALLRAMREGGFEQPVVILTGHLVEDELENLKAQGLSGWLLKPPRLDQLASALASALGSH